VDLDSPVLDKTDIQLTHWKQLAENLLNFKAVLTNLYSAESDSQASAYVRHILSKIERCERVLKSKQSELEGSDQRVILPTKLELRKIIERLFLEQCSLL